MGNVNRVKTRSVRRSSSSRVLRTVMRILVLGIAILSAVACWIAFFGLSSKPRPSDCIIVLGCRLYGTIPSPFLMARLDEGFRLLREGYAQRIIVSGGQGPDEEISEAEAMKNYLVNKGADPSVIITEDRSTSTVENLRFSLAKMEQHGLETAIVVSNRYHQLRASIIASRLGIEASYSGVFVSQHRKSEVSGFLREIPALLYTLVVR